MSKSAADKESEKYISMLNLVSKKKVIVTNLSGGMKRKVNLGIALIGDSKVISFLKNLEVKTSFQGCDA